ncbi:hypothetical protein ACJX0J_012935, partial [Zea mays]
AAFYTAWHWAAFPEVVQPPINKLEDIFATVIKMVYNLQHIISTLVLLYLMFLTFDVDINYLGRNVKTGKWRFIAKTLCFGLKCLVTFNWIVVITELKVVEA